MHRWYVPLLARVQLDDAVSLVGVLADGGCVIRLHDRQELVWLDEQLRQQHRMPIGWANPYPYSAGVAVSAEGDLVAVAGPDRLVVCAPDGTRRFTLPHPVWPDLLNCSGAAVWTQGGALLWVVAPTGGKVDGDQVVLVDASRWAVLGRALLRIGQPCGYHLRAHPDGRVVGVDGGAGQDGNYLRWVRWNGRRLALTEYGPTDRILTDIHPSGREFVSTYHSSGEPVLARHRYPDQVPIDWLHQDSVFGSFGKIPAISASLMDALTGGPADSFGYEVVYFGSTLLATTCKGRVLLLTCDPMWAVASLDLEAYPSTAELDVTDLSVVAGRWLLTTSSDGSVRLYDLLVIEASLRQAASQLQLGLD